MLEPRILSPCISGEYETAEGFLDLAGPEIQGSESFYSMIIFPGWCTLLSQEGVLSRLQAIAESNITWVVSGGLPWIDDSGRSTLRSFLIDDSGTILGFYEGCHLQVDEPKKDDSGMEPFIFKHYGATFALADINELFYPEYFRSMALCGVEVVIISSYLPGLKRRELDILMRARALENQMYMICSSTLEAQRAEENVDFTVIGPDGNRISAEAIDGNLVLYTLKPGYVKKMRKKFKVLESRRPDLYFPLLKL